MSREPTTINLEEDHREWMDSQEKNRSEFINNLIEAYRNGGGVVEGTMNQYRKREIETEMQSLQQQLEILQEEYDELNQDITSKGEAKEEVLDEAADTLSKHQLTEDSQPVEFWADKADMSIDAFLTEMWERKE